MDIKAGYQLTEVGVIPEDWEVRQLGELGQWKGGMTPSMQNPNYWVNGTLPWISSGDVKTVQLKETGYYITHEALKQRATTMLPTDSIVLVTRSGILRKYLPVATNVVPMAINQDIKALIPKKDFRPSFILYALIERGPRILSRCMKSGTTVESIEFKWLKAFSIAIPPLPEQRAIAEALSDMDALLDGLDRLIAKKRDLKQAAMQQLLTGQTRLPGFSGAWEDMTLGKIAVFLKGKGLSKSAISEYGAEPCIHYGELFTQYTEKIHVIVNRTSETQSCIRSVANDVLMPTSDVTPRGLAKASCILVDGIILGSDILIIRSERSRVFGTFLSFIIRREENQVLQFVTGTTVYHLYGSEMRKFRFKLPPLPEQTAIAEVLTAMDDELAALVQRREKTRHLKQAMMQTLLSGQTRLIPRKETTT